MMTRKQYLDGVCSHEDYYGEIADAAHIKGSAIALDRVKAALKAGDVHLNSIPLREWDAWGAAVARVVRQPLEERGDFVTAAGLVCIVKTAARRAAEIS